MLLYKTKPANKPQNDTPNHTNIGLGNVVRSCEELLLSGTQLHRDDVRCDVPQFVHLHMHVLVIELDQVLKVLTMSTSFLHQVGRIVLNSL